MIDITIYVQTINGVDRIILAILFKLIQDHFLKNIARGIIGENWPPDYWAVNRNLSVSSVNGLD